MLTFLELVRSRFALARRNRLNRFAVTRRLPDIYCYHLAGSKITHDLNLVTIVMSEGHLDQPQVITTNYWQIDFVVAEYECVSFYPLVRELIDTGAVALWPVSRFTQTIAGVAPAAARQWEAAEEHFRIAMQQAEAFPQRLEQAEIRSFHAMTLMDRAA